MRTEELTTQAVDVFRETGLTPRRLADDRSNALRMMGDESLLRAELISALTEIVEYEGDADNALEDEYVMDRARRILAKAREGWA